MKPSVKLQLSLEDTHFANGSQPTVEEMYDHCLAIAQALVLNRIELSALTPSAVQLRYIMEFRQSTNLEQYSHFLPFATVSR